ncbi:hypothetical protein ACVJ19_001823 [Bradyrhizobium sp. USDA 376]
MVVGVGDAARKHRADAAGQPGILAFDADHEVRVELPVRTDLHAAEETTVAVVAGGEAVEIVVAGEGAAEMATDVEAGPVVDRRDVGRRGRLVIVAVAEIGTDGRRGSARNQQRHGRKQNLLHRLELQHLCPRLARFPRRRWFCR